MKTIYLRNIAIYLVFFLTLINFAYAQQSIFGAPKSFENNLNLTEFKKPNYILPSINNEIEQNFFKTNEKNDCQKCDDKYIGKGVNVKLDVKASSVEKILEGKGRLWVLTIKSNTAYGLQFYFSKFKLPQGATLYIYNDEKKFIGGFSELNNPVDENKSIQFGTDFISGEVAYVELFEPFVREFDSELEIATINHIYKDVFNPKSGAYGSSQDCNINVSCPEGVGWEKEISSVAIILAYSPNYHRLALCSGALLNNSDYDAKPYFLTAKHCMDNVDNDPNEMLFDYSTWLFRFKYETTSCNNNNGFTVGSFHSVYGSTFLAGDGWDSPNSDYLLLLLSPLPSYIEDIVCFSGWTINEEQEPPYYGFHHPSGDIKKLSISENELLSTQYNNKNYDPTGGHWMTYWNLGVTEGGSSGSPLFNNSHKVVGQLHGGTAECDGLTYNGKPDWYGKFSKSWELDNFSYWLAPFQNHLTSLETYCPSNTVPQIGTGTVSTGGLPCATSVFHLDGFDINNQNNLVIETCIDKGIKITGPNNTSSGSKTLPFHWTVKTGNCDDMKRNQGYNCGSNFLFSPNCECEFLMLHISVTEVDQNLNIIGTEQSDWMNFKPVFNAFCQGYPYSGFDLLEHLPNSANILPGRFYRIKLASVYGAQGQYWSEKSNYIHTYTSNNYISNSSTIMSYYGDDITLNNVVLNPLNTAEVKANNEILIQPGNNYSSISADTKLYIGFVSCNQFKGNRININNSNFVNDNKIDKSILYSNELIKKREFVKVYPNPSNKVLNFELINFELLPDLSVDIYDLFGRKIMSFPMLKNSNVTSINTEELSPMPYIYIVKSLMNSEIIRGVFFVNK